MERELATRVKQTIYEPYYNPSHYRNKEFDPLFREVEIEINPQARIQKSWDIIGAIAAEKDVFSLGDALMDLPFRTKDDFQVMKHFSEIISQQDFSTDRIKQLQHWLSHVRLRQTQELIRDNPIRGVRDRYDTFSCQVESVLAYHTNPEDFPTISSFFEEITAPRK